MASIEAMTSQAKFLCGNNSYGQAPRNRETYPSSLSKIVMVSIEKVRVKVRSCGGVLPSARHLEVLNIIKPSSLIKLVVVLIEKVKCRGQFLRAGGVLSSSMHLEIFKII